MSQHQPLARVSDGYPPHHQRRNMLGGIYDDRRETVGELKAALAAYHDNQPVQIFEDAELSKPPSPNQLKAAKRTVIVICDFSSSHEPTVSFAI